MAHTNSKTLDTTTSVSFNSKFRAVFDLVNANANMQMSSSHDHADGNSLLTQNDVRIHDDFTLTTDQVKTFDLIGGSDLDEFGDVIAFSIVVGIYVTAHEDSAPNAQVKMAGNCLTTKWGSNAEIFIEEKCSFLWVSAGGGVLRSLPEVLT